MRHSEGSMKVMVCAGIQKKGMVLVKTNPHMRSQSMPFKAAQHVELPDGEFAMIGRYESICDVVREHEDG